MGMHARGDRAERHACIESLEQRTLLSIASAASLFADINPGPAGSQPNLFIELDGKLLFTADDGQHGRELWRTDGTAGDATMVVDAVPGMARGVGSLVRAGRYAVFLTTSTNEIHIWSTDGTPEGTRVIQSVTADSQALGFDVASTGDVAFIAVREPFGNARALWRTDGTAEGTYPVADGLMITSPLWTVGGKLFFRNASSTFGEELWVSDGTTAGTRLFVDFVPGPGSSQPSMPVPFKGGYVLSLHDGLYWTDGTLEGTRLLAGSVQAFRGLESIDAVEMGGHLYFTAFSNGQSAMWRTDGTPQGTIAIGPAGRNLTRVGNTLFFIARTSDDTGFALWKTNGTPDSAVMLGAVLRDVAPNTVGLTPWLQAVGGYVYTYGNDDGAYGLYRSDGTVAGTVKVADAGVRDYVGVLGGKLLFTATDEAWGLELWQIELPAPINPPPDDLPPDNPPPPAPVSGRPQVNGPRLALRNGRFVLTLRPGKVTPSYWTIDWGDGRTQTVRGNAAQVVHRYAKAGRYRITAWVTTATGTTLRADVAGQPRGAALTAAINNPRPQPAIAAVEAGVPGQPISFAGRTSDGDSTGHLLAWDFGDEGKRRPQFVPITRDSLNPSHAYAKPGVYTVRLWVRNPAGRLGMTMWKVRIADIVVRNTPGPRSEKVLVIGGTPGNDTINLHHRWGGRIDVVINGRSRGLFAADRLIVHAGDGDDIIRVDDLIKTPVEIHGGNGTDRVRASGRQHVHDAEIIE